MSFNRLKAEQTLADYNDHDECAMTERAPGVYLCDARRKAYQVAEALQAALAEIDRLGERQQEHLQLIAKLTRETPYPDEIKECKAHRAALIAEVGTLRGRVAELEQETATMRPVLDAALQHGNKFSDCETLDLAVDTYRSPAPAVRHETSASIAQWANETFGPVDSNLSIWRRAAKEFGELHDKLVANDADPGAPEECADVAIVLARILVAHGKDLQAEVDRKMRINRARIWRLTGDGHGQHVEPEK